jgi:chemotaxis signal transduction protein
MSRRQGAWLLVRVSGRLVGLALARVVEVLPPATVHPIPSREPSVRGVTRVRGRLVTVVHLGALLDGAACPTVQGEAAVMVDVAGSRLCLELDGAEEVLLGAGLPIPHGTTLPWASAVARHRDALVPLLDLDALAARIRETATA